MAKKHSNNKKNNKQSIVSDGKEIVFFAAGDELTAEFLAVTIDPKKKDDTATLDSIALEKGETIEIKLAKIDGIDTKYVEKDSEYTKQREELTNQRLKEPHKSHDDKTGKNETKFTLFKSPADKKLAKPKPVKPVKPPKVKKEFTHGKKIAIIISSTIGSIILALLLVWAAILFIHRNEDYDGDKLKNKEEFWNRTDKWDSDTDDDLINDYNEVYVSRGRGEAGPETRKRVSGYDPRKYEDHSVTDFDNDTYTDLDEQNLTKDILVNGANQTVKSDMLYFDTDHDGYSDNQEIEIYGTNPSSNNTDGDDLTDDKEIYIYQWAKDQGATQDVIDDYDPANGQLHTETDADGDGLKDTDEVIEGTNLVIQDTDGDSLIDGDEVHGMIGYASDGKYFTLPLLPDSDGDGLNDGFEINGDGGGIGYIHDPHTHPRVVDTDEDGLSDGEEITGSKNKKYNYESTDPRDKKTDDDGLTDGDEVLIHKTNPNVDDTDQDGLNDSNEVNGESNGFDPKPTNPLIQDTDNDGLSDHEEVTGSKNTHGHDYNGQMQISYPIPDIVSTYWDINEPTDPNKADTDGDGLSDFEEVTEPYDVAAMIQLNQDLGAPIYGQAHTNIYTNPNLADSDGDFVYDNVEKYETHSDALMYDTDLEGLRDGEEYFNYHTNLLDIDSDDDQLVDEQERTLFISGSDGTLDMNNPDTDGDTIQDGVEFQSVCLGQYTIPANEPGHDVVLLESTTDPVGDDLLVLCSNPLTKDTDRDRLTDDKELELGTEMWYQDSDGDGVWDGLDASPNNGGISKTIELKVTNSVVEQLNLINYVSITYRPE